MIDKLSEIEKSALDALQSVHDELSLDVWRVTLSRTQFGTDGSL